VLRALACTLALAPALALAQAAEPASEPAQPAGDTAASAPSASSVEDARAHFQRGVDYYTEGDLNAALIELQRAYELQPTYRLLYNLGQVTYEQRDYVAAERYFRDYLEQGGSEIDAARRQEVEGELEKLKDRVADVRLETDLPNARLFIDDTPVGQSPLARPVRVSAGQRRIRAESPGYAPVTRVVDVVGGEALIVQLTFGPSLNASATTAPVDVGEASSSNAALWTGIATGVLGLGAGAMALWTNSDDQKYADALEGPTTRDELDELSDRTKTKALITDVLLGATLVTGTITVILLLSGDDEPAETKAEHARLQVGPGTLRAAF
jgi:tetratricopeptide (TPR) repeat protein